MPDFNLYELDDNLRVLLQGPPGAGKSTLCFQFPDPWFFDLDHNLGGPLRFARVNGLPLPVGYDVVDRDDKGQPIPRRMQYKRLNELLLLRSQDPRIKTFIFDSGTIWSELLIEEVLRLQGKNEIADYKDGRQFWNFFAIAAKQMLGALTSLRKHIVVPIHERTKTDPQGNVVYPVKNSWPGQTGEMLGLWFTDVWRCETSNKPGGIVQYDIRTTPNYQFALKNSLGLPEKMPFDWKVIEAKLKGGK